MAEKPFDLTPGQRRQPATIGNVADFVDGTTESLAKEVGAQLSAVRKRISELEFMVAELEAGAGAIRFLANSGKGGK